MFSYNWESLPRILQSLVQLGITERLRRGQRHDTSEDQIYWAAMRDHFRKCTRKGVADPITRQKIKYEGCVDRSENHATYRNTMFISGRSEEKLQSWDARVRGLDDHAELQQLGQLREPILSGRLNSKQSANVATPVKQDPEFFCK